MSSSARALRSPPQACCASRVHLRCVSRACRPTHVRFPHVQCHSLRAIKRASAAGRMQPVIEDVKAKLPNLFFLSILERYDALSPRSSPSTSISTRALDAVEQRCRGRLCQALFRLSTISPQRTFGRLGQLSSGAGALPHAISGAWRHGAVDRVFVPIRTAARDV